MSEASIDSSIRFCSSTSMEFTRATMVSMAGMTSLAFLRSSGCSAMTLP